jgi:hypothetical protein
MFAFDVEAACMLLHGQTEPVKHVDIVLAAILKELQYITY